MQRFAQVGGARAGVAADRADATASIRRMTADAGQPLPAELRSDMESRFGHDFRDIRVHADAAAAEAARSVHARAYTLGRDLVFGGDAWQPHAESGRRLIAHELAHAVQQRGAGGRALQPSTLRVSQPGDPAEREADRAADAALGSGPAPALEASELGVARAALDVAGIKQDIDKGLSAPSILDSWIQILGSQTGEIANAFAADPPSKAGTGGGTPSPDPKPVPVDKTLPLQGFFFPADVHHTDKKALVLGGFHGDEHPGWETAEALVTELSTASTRLSGSPLHFHTLVIPRVNTGAIADELAGKKPKHWRNRCNRQGVDLNRNFPVAGATASSTDCPNNAKGAPIQPEIDGVIDVLNQFQPDRIVSLHAMQSAGSTLRGGVFADPNAASLPGGPAAVDLAQGMARLIPSAANRPSNALTGTSFNPVYPGDRPGVVSGGTSLGAYGPTGVPGKTNVPVITMEAPELAPLGKGQRTVEEFLRPLRGFLTDPAQLDARADEDIVRDIQGFGLDERRAFLTGRRPSKDDIFQRIRLRIDTAVGRLNALSPPVTIKVVSSLRPFTEVIGSQQSQLDIVFEKFFLAGSRAGGWDTLPDKYFVGGNRAKGINRTDHKAPNWFDETAATRFATILQFSALPGVSRHHWDTDVDFNSITNKDWEPPNTLAKLDPWLKANAAKAGFVQAFTAGRTGGYSEEKWHYSYAPIAIALRTMWNRDVRAKEDVFDPISAEFQKRAKARNLALPADFDASLRAIPIADFTNKIGPGL